MLVRLLVISDIGPGASEIGMQALLAAAQVYCRRLDVTGRLVRSARHVAQVLEGRADAVALVMERLQLESPHLGQRVISREVVSKRRFGEHATGLVRRYDIAAELEELHGTGRIGDLDAEAVVERLLLAGADDSALRMEVVAPRLVEPAPRYAGVSRRR